MNEHNRARGRPATDAKDGKADRRALEDSRALVVELRGRVAGGERPLVIDTSTLHRLMLCHLAAPTGTCGWHPRDTDAPPAPESPGLVGTFEGTDVVVADSAGFVRAFYAVKAERDALRDEVERLRGDSH